MTDKHQDFMNQLNTAVFQSKGVTERWLRMAVKTAAAPSSEQLELGESPIPVVLRPYLNKVARYAYKVTDRDIETLKTQGYVDDAIFELTVSAAVGAGLGRLQRGLAALNGKPEIQRRVGNAPR